MAPDGRSIVTSVGQRRSEIWMHNASGDRAMSIEGIAFAPKLSPRRAAPVLPCSNATREMPRSSSFARWIC